MKAIKMKDVRKKLEQIGAEGGKKLDEDAGEFSFHFSLILGY